MPVSKISDAPPNIRKLNGAPLTLAQINKILAMYDAIKKEGKVDNPMAVAIAQWKRGHVVRNGKWYEKSVVRFVNIGGDNYVTCREKDNNLIAVLDRGIVEIQLNVDDQAVLFLHGDDDVRKFVISRDADGNLVGTQVKTFRDKSLAIMKVLALFS